jgi:phosphoglycerate dehydrogenase-like enzyme
MAEFVVATTSPVPDWVAEAAADVGVRFVTLSPLDADAVRVQLEDLRPHGYLLTWPELGPFVDEALAEAAGDLRLVTYAGQSTEPAFYTANLDVAALEERGITLTTMPGAHLAVAEAAMGFLLAFELDLVQRNAARKSDPAAVRLPARRRPGLVGSTLGVVGMGRIGRRVAELAVAYGMSVRYYSRTRKPEVERELGASFHELPELLAICDSVSLHLPMGAAEGLIDAHVLSHASELTLINTTSIATIVEPQALLAALDSGRVARFGLEGNYPPPYDEQLRHHGNDRVLLLPPYSSYHTPYGDRLGWQNYLATLGAVVQGEDVPYRIR